MTQAQEETSKTNIMPFIATDLYYQHILKFADNNFGIKAIDIHAWFQSAVCLEECEVAPVATGQCVPALILHAMLQSSAASQTRNKDGSSGELGGDNRDRVMDYV